MTDDLRHRVPDHVGLQTRLLRLVEQELPAAGLAAGEHDEVGLNVGLGVVGVGDVAGQVVELRRAYGAETLAQGVVDDGAGDGGSDCSAVCVFITSVTAGTVPKSSLLLLLFLFLLLLLVGVAGWRFERGQTR